MVEFALISDVHIDRVYLDPAEIAENANGCKIVAVCGDISDNFTMTMDWIRALKNEFDEVIWLPGNHDFYLEFAGTSAGRYPCLVSEIQEYYKNISEMYGITYLNRNSITIDDITFIGATGWHDFIAGEPYSTEQQINMWWRIDEPHVTKWSYGAVTEKSVSSLVLEEASKDFEYIKSSVEESTGSIVVLTHHIPHRYLTTHRPENIVWTKLNGMFVNTMFETITDGKIKYWCYGHTHYRNMKTIGNIDYICNPKGYKGENPSWFPVIINV